MDHLQIPNRRHQLISLSLSGVSGVLAGIFLVCSVTPLRLMLGTNHEVDTAMVLTAAACCWWARSSSLLPQRSSSWLMWSLPFAGIWALLLPSLLSLLLRMTSSIPLNRMEAPILAYGTIFIISLICLAPTFLALRLSHLSSGSQGSTFQWTWMFGLGIACLLLPTLVLPFVGIKIMAWVGLTLSCLWLAGTRYYSDSIPEDSAEPTQRSTSVGWLRPLVALLTGATLALTAFIAGQLIPRNLTADLALLAGLVVGMGFALARRSWKSTATMAFSSSVVCLFLAAWTGFVAAGYPLWTLFCLQINAWVDNVALLFALRMSFLMLLVLPAGFLVRRLAGSSNRNDAAPMIPLLIATGFIIAPWIPCSPHTAAGGLVLLALLLTCLAWAQENFRLPRLLWQKIGTAALAGVAIVGLVFSGNLNPQNSERILFSSGTLQSLRQGVSAEQLNWLDDFHPASSIGPQGVSAEQLNWLDESRPLQEFSTLTNHLSLWKYHGSQIVVRRNGIPIGLHSSNPKICPHNASDILPVLLPLVLHPDPEDVLVLGIHPPTLLTCHNWPLQSVRTVDGESTAHQMINWLTSPATGTLNLQNGPDFRFSRVDPVLSLASRHNHGYDLITCPILHPLAVGASSLITREFYARALTHLNEGGIFSQRVPYYDLGPEVIQELAATMRDVFEDVRVIESIPGELIFLCGGTRLPEIDDTLVERLKTPQNRRLLAQCGWDWSLILGRGGLDDAALQQLTATRNRIHRSSNTQLAFWLPVEVSRWGHKADLTRQSLAKYGQALRVELGETAGAKEVSERLEDLSLAHKIQKDHPNDPWAYRAALKSRLQDRPRSTIMQVNHQLKRVMDPEDQRRKEYLLTLGPKARQPVTNQSEIQRLAEFEFPFDPLVSMFVHHETALLLERCSPAAPKLQLSHLLHTIYYSAASDQSVRNVTDALELLCSQDEVVSSPTDRWDEVNSLLQTLAQRWQLRLSTNQTSKYEITDTEKSVAAAHDALKLLEESYPSAGLTSDEWQLRKATIEAALLRPLNHHRSEHVREARLAPAPPDQG